MIDTDLVAYLSGGSSNTDPNLALGDDMSSTVVSLTPLNNLFDNVSSAERASGTVEYRCFYIKNEHSTEELQNASVFISKQTDSSTTAVDIGLDSAGINGTAEIIPNETTAPVSVTFTRPAAPGDAIVVGDLEPGDYFAVWVRRTVDALTEARASDAFDIRIQGKPV
jgi:hypothetical protein